MRQNNILIFPRNNNNIFNLKNIIYRLANVILYKIIVDYAIVFNRVLHIFYFLSLGEFFLFLRVQKCFQNPKMDKKNVQKRDSAFFSVKIPLKTPLSDWNAFIFKKKVEKSCYDNF